MTGYAINERGRQATIESMQADADTEKFGHKQIQYGTTNDPKTSCATCRYFGEPKPGVLRCALVRDPIHRDGWCQYWHSPFNS